MTRISLLIFHKLSTERRKYYGHARSISRGEICCLGVMEKNLMSNSLNILDALLIMNGLDFLDSGNG